MEFKVFQIFQIFQILRTGLFCLALTCPMGIGKEEVFFVVSKFVFAFLCWMEPEPDSGTDPPSNFGSGTSLKRPAPVLPYRLCDIG